MNFFVKQHFIGLINNVEIFDETVYNHMCWILPEIEERFGVNLTDEFIQCYANDFTQLISDLYNATLSEVENELYSIVEDADNIKEIHFECYGYEMKYVNKMLKEL